MIALPFTLVGIGFALATTSMVACVMGAVPPERAGMASSVSNTSRQTGGVLGIAVMGSLLTSGMADHGASGMLSGLHTGLLVAACGACGGALLAALTLRPGRTRQAADKAGAADAADGQSAQSVRT
jgi:DHA2 family methylenomycin A resistance protein-like MFS transporter